MSEIEERRPVPALETVFYGSLWKQLTKLKTAKYSPGPINAVPNGMLERYSFANCPDHRMCPLTLALFIK